MIISFNRNFESFSKLLHTGSTVAHARAHPIGPLPSISINRHVLRIAVASTTGSDDHSVRGGGLLLVDTRHNYRLKLIEKV